MSQLLKSTKSGMNYFEIEMTVYDGGGVTQYKRPYGDVPST